MIASASAQDAAQPELRWEPVPDATQVTIRENVYEAESGGRDWSIRRATNTTADVTRFEVRAGDTWGEDAQSGETKERAEFDGYRQTWREGTDVWCAYAFLMEAGRPYPSAWTIIGQLPGTRMLALYIYFRNEIFSISTGRQTHGANFVAQGQFAGRLSRAVWHHAVFHYRGNAFDKGRLEFWLDGRKIVDFTGPLGGTANDSFYWKYGIYRGYGPIAVPFAVQFANMEIGTKDLTERIANPLEIR